MEHDEEDEVITEEEMLRIRKLLKRRKSPGPDAWTTDALKDLSSSKSNKEELFKLLGKWWEEEILQVNFL